MWSAIRWLAFNVMNTMPYTDLPKAGITKPSNLLQFPWDNDTSNADLPTDDEVDEEVELLRQINEGNE